VRQSHIQVSVDTAISLCSAQTETWRPTIKIDIDLDSRISARQQHYLDRVTVYFTTHYKCILILRREEILIA